MPVLMGQGAGSFLDDMPSTSWGAMGRWENQDDEELDYEDEIEEQTLPASTALVKEVTPTVSEVVRGDRSENRHQELAGNLPRGEDEMGIAMNIRGASGGLISKGGVDVSIQVDSVADSGAGAVKIVGGSDVIGRRRDEAVCFIMHLIEKGLSAVTIAGKLAGIAFYAPPGATRRCRLRRLLLWEDGCSGQEHVGVREEEAVLAAASHYQPLQDKVPHPQSGPDLTAD
ncbi:hypothetical protein NDU88_004301 [Pleurodeles waltl]|uniref:Uncharacterized protein n=1 Tax=Pleurodeles waltl TaxID=8319 RepID=A0AAV7TR47_PLEWA|nr:hypothetical protein NDU88_004301 [Pleurodeles waltl]